MKSAGMSAPEALRRRTDADDVIAVFASIARAVVAFIEECALNPCVSPNLRHQI